MASLAVVLHPRRSRPTVARQTRRLASAQPNRVSSWGSSCLRLTRYAASRIRVATPCRVGRPLATPRWPRAAWGFPPLAELAFGTHKLGPTGPSHRIEALVGCMRYQSARVACMIHLIRSPSCQALRAFATQPRLRGAPATSRARFDHYSSHRVVRVRWRCRSPPPRLTM